MLRIFRNTLFIGDIMTTIREGTIFDFASQLQILPDDVLDKIILILRE